MQVEYTHCVALGSLGHWIQKARSFSKRDRTAKFMFLHTSEISISIKRIYRSFAVSTSLGKCGGPIWDQLQGGGPIWTNHPFLDTECETSFPLRKSQRSGSTIWSSGQSILSFFMLHTNYPECVNNTSCFPKYHVVCELLPRDLLGKLLLSKASACSALEQGAPH